MNNDLLIGSITHKQANDILKKSIESNAVVRNLTQESLLALKQEKQTRFQVERANDSKYMLKLKGLGTLKTYVNKPDKPGLNTARALLTSVGMSTSVAKSSVKVPTHSTAIEVMTKARSASALGPADQGATRGVDRLNAIL